MPKIARIGTLDREPERDAEKLTKIARSTTEQAADAARASTAEAADMQRQIVLRSAGESAELGRSIVDLLGQQTRHNMQVATAFGRAVNWAEVAEIQRDFLAGSFDRMSRLGECYRTMMQAGMNSMAFPSRH